MSKSYAGHLLRALISDLRKVLSDVLYLVAWIGALGGIGVTFYAMLLNLRSFLESPLGIKPDFQEPYLLLGGAILFWSGVVAFVRWVIHRPSEDSRNV